MKHLILEHNNKNLLHPQLHPVTVHSSTQSNCIQYLASILVFFFFFFFFFWGGGDKLQGRAGWHV